MPYDVQSDNFANIASAPAAPAKDMVEITPHDSNDLAPYAKALRVFVPEATASATIRVTPLSANDADTVDLEFLAGVSIEPLSVRRVWNTGTTAGITIHAYLK